MQALTIVLVLGGAIGLFGVFVWRHMKGFQTADHVDVWALLLGGAFCTAFLMGVDGVVTYKVAKDLEGVPSPYESPEFNPVQ